MDNNLVFLCFYVLINYPRCVISEVEFTGVILFADIAWTWWTTFYKTCVPQNRSSNSVGKIANALTYMPKLLRQIENTLG